MKKRIIITVAAFLGLIAILLIITIFQLYKEAEKVQRSIFANEVLTAGDNVIKKIDATLKNDTLAFSALNEKNEDDSLEIVYRKDAKVFLFDSITSLPVGVINTSVLSNENNASYIHRDTIIFDSTFRKLYPLVQSLWVSDDMKDNYKNGRLELVEMDSNTIKLLNNEFLYRIIKASLLEENVTSDFDFALYNAFTHRFVVPPHITTDEKILKSEYIFSLNTSDKFIAPHYLILFFPAERGIYFQRMSTITILIICFIVIIIFISGYTLVSLYKQKKIVEVKNDFINNMTHEFKTPISTISLACEGLTDSTVIADPNLQKTYVSIIQDENDRLKKMVNNILQIARLKKGQLQMDISVVDVHQLITKVVNGFLLQVSSNNGSITMKLEAADNKILADATHIENVIINVIENAIKYSPTRPNIVISTLNEKKFIILSIEDHGIGIAKQNIKKIFQEFYRVPKGNIHDTKGYGLGLGYVKKIVSLHGGYVTVKSELNIGTTFYIYLPIKK